MASKVMQTVISIAGTLDPSLSKAVSGAVGKIGGLNKGMGGISGKAVAVGAAMGGIAVATGKAVIDAGKKLNELGENFKKSSNTIRVGTGATGPELEALNKDFDSVYSSVPTSMDNASQAIADYNTRLGLTGAPLQNISKQAIQVSSLLGNDLNGVIENSSKAFSQWGISSGQMGGKMDYLFKVSQSTGIGFTDLSQKMQKFGPQLQNMGYSFDSAAALMGQLDKAGVNTDEVLGAMKKSVGVLAKSGVDASTGMQQYCDKIKGAKTEAQAASIASEVFGAKAGSTMANAIRNGTLSVSDLTKSLETSKESINSAAEDTYTLSDRLKIMKQGMEVALKPLANTVFDGLEAVMPSIQAAMQQLAPVISQVVQSAQPFVEQFLQGAVSTLTMLLPLLAELAASLFPLLSQLIGSLLPPILQLFQSIAPILVQIAQAILPPITQILTTLLPIITQIITAILPVVLSLLQQLMPIIQPLLQLLVQILQQVILPIIQPLMQLVQALLPPIAALIGGIVQAIGPLLDFLKPIADVLGTIIGFVGKLISWGAGAISGIFGALSGGGKSSGGGATGKFATGGFTNGLSIAGEDPRYPQEAVLSFNPAYRRKNIGYWSEAGRKLGVMGSSGASLSGSSSSSVVYDLSGMQFSPKIYAASGTNSSDLMRQLKALMPEFVDMVQDALAEREEAQYADCRIY
ncbi:MAG: phage tail tape measure protein [Oscillospiraceae bacterium]|nr:phage tail tape measure protein [Oscillospiraceae bacterium]